MSFLAAAATLAGLVLLLAHLLRAKRRVCIDVPLVHSDAPLAARLQSGYAQHKDRVFKLRCPHGEQLVLPSALLDELKLLPTTTISFAQSLVDQFWGNQTLIGLHDETLVATAVVADMRDELAYAMPATLPQDKEWRPFQAHPAVLRIVALLSGRVFVGQALSRNDEFLNCIVMYTIDSFSASTRLYGVHPLLRPLARFFMPELRRVRGHLATMKRLVKPLVEERLRKGADAPNDMVSWNLEHSPSALRTNVDYQALQQLQASFAAVHTTALLLTNIIFDLAARPEYIQPLREEVQMAFGTDGGVITKAAMSKLVKMDSFMAEVQRFNPPGIMTFNRAITGPVTLSSGLHLPKGTWLAAPSSQIAMDPDIWDNPTKFDGFRFERLRQRQGASGRYQFVSTGPDMLLFGYGNQACPGRFFVSNEIKLILATLLLEYELKLPGDRPDTIINDVSVRPDSQKEVLIRRRA
ncbi:cytochrome p450 [Diplodia corticola]|uniref:Cytochrome p450 n=1 Tax=Diplodia corticola TaxID=236234 RepID=A0A1J9RJJ8_9PEZI|nr:cytochrome p450 [Diplodia corticola]OJD28711.1 cytochrome p450 [Diplodia corticola]